MAQNFFRSYPKLAGMTGTAATEVAEFSNIYNLDVTIVPTNKVTCPAQAVWLAGTSFRRGVINRSSWSVLQS